MAESNYNSQNYLFFNSDIEVDVIKIDLDTSLTLNQALELKNTYGLSTTLYNNFNKNIYANYNAPPSNHLDALSTISIYRQIPGQTYYDFVCYLPVGRISFYDFNIKNNEFYHYLAAIPVPVIDNTQPGGMGMEYKIYQNRYADGTPKFHHAYWKTWSLTNIRESETIENTYEQYGYTWNLALNIESENVNQNTSVTSWDTLGKYPKLSIGKKNYNSSTFTGLLGVVADYQNIIEEENDDGDLIEISKNVFGYTERFIYKSNKVQKDNENLLEIMNQYLNKKATLSEIKYANEMEKLQAWREFVNDGSLKLLKDLKGNSWIVQVIENPSYEINNKSHSAPTTIKFTWQEVENSDNISIINMD